MIVEVALLAGAVATISKPEIHQRFKNLMTYWPAALVTPWVIMFNRQVQRQFLIGETVEHMPKPREHRSPEKKLGDYRRAMALLIHRAELLQQDQDLLNLCLRLLTSAEVMDEIDNGPDEVGEVPARVTSADIDGTVTNRP